MNPDPVAPPQPTVVIWFKVYAGFLCLVYAALVVAGVALLFVDLDVPAEEQAGLRVATILIFSMCVPLAVIFFVPLVVPPRPWVWTYSLILICLGMTSVCFLPFVIPLLIYWIKPDVKAYYGKA
jgi:hypothetical protein